jgi:predicted small secreted protein
MKKTIITVLAASSLVLAACGSDSGGGGDGGDGGESQSELATMLTETLDEAGIPYDADCINDKTSQLSDEDAEAIVAAGVDGDPDVSDEADAIGETLTECIEVDAAPTTT